MHKLPAIPIEKLRELEEETRIYVLSITEDLTFVSQVSVFAFSVNDSRNPGLVFYFHYDPGSDPGLGGYFLKHEYRYGAFWFLRYIVE